MVPISIKMWNLKKLWLLKKIFKKKFSALSEFGTSLVVQWLRLHTPNAGGPGSIPVRELDPKWVCSVAQSCLIHRNPMDCSLPDSSVHGILQARILGWVAIAFSRRSPGPRDRTCVSWVSCIGSQILYHCTTWEACASQPRAPLLQRKIPYATAKTGSGLLIDFFLKVASGYSYLLDQIN